MNRIYKTFCRIYQGAFRLAFPILPYREPEICGSIFEIPEVLNKKKIQKVLLVTDTGLRTNGNTKALETELEEKGICCVVYDKTCANPTVHNVEEARELYIQEMCGGLIAFGGGSSMDCAKAVGARVAFSKSYVGYIHAVAHSLGGQYNIPHGLANSVLMPIILGEYGACVHRQLYELGIAAGVAEETDSHEEGAEKFIEAIIELNRRMDIPAVLPGIKREDISTMARHAAREANPLYPVPRIMSARELERFYFRVADWSIYEYKRIIRKAA